MIFGPKKPQGKTILLVDVENGSVGAALVRLEEGKAPALFGEVRQYASVEPTRSSTSLLQSARDGLHNTLRKVSEVVARLRNNPRTAPTAELTHAAIFLAAPWGKPDFAAGPSFASVVQEQARLALHSTLGRMPLSYYTAAGSVAAGMRRLMPYEQSYLVCNVTGEVSELMLVHNGVVTGYATVPMGRHSVVRTLRAHGGMGEHEAHSLLRLGNTHHAASEAAARFYAEELAETVESLLRRSPVESVYIVGHGREGEWFARALSQSGVVGDLFPQGGVVRALTPRHVSAHLQSHGERPDLPLSLQALFADDHLR